MNLDREVQAVVDAAMNYAAVARTIDVDTPPAIVDVARHRREALFKAVDRLAKK